MPEGDTVHKLARALARDVEGRPLEGLWLRDRGWVELLAGRRVREVAALGKHLLVAVGPSAEPAGAPLEAADRTSDDWVLHVHLGMNGRFHRYREGERWQRPARQASILLRVRGWLFVGFRVPVAELLRRGALAQHPQLRSLGPDLLAGPVREAEVLRRARGAVADSVASLLLDQRVACGIGNVYKSEVLFLEGVHPRCHASALSDARLLGLYRTARRLLANNLGGGWRTTTRPLVPGRPARRREARLFVYDRAGRPCRRCGAAIESARLGDEARPTYWCPTCQPALAPRAAERSPAAREREA